MRYIIIEDERLPYEDLRRSMERLRPEYELVGWIVSQEQGRLQLKQVEADLIISDIRLADGDSLELLEGVGCEVPVIFTTAYDEYALRAFKLNSVDYLLKPIRDEELESALCKLEHQQTTRAGRRTMERLRRSYDNVQGRRRFAVQEGENYLYVAEENVAAFCSAGRYVMLHCMDGRQFTISYTMEQLEAMLDRERFFRLSRGCIANIQAVKNAKRWMKDGLKVSFCTKGLKDEQVSRQRKHDFLRWLDGRTEV